MIPAAGAQTLPDELRSAGVSVLQWKRVQDEVARVAAARGVSERALSAVVQKIGLTNARAGDIDVGQVLSLIDSRALELREMQEKLAGLEKADDPAISRLVAKARASIETGDLTGVDQQLADVVSAELGEIALDKAKLARRESHVASAISERGRLAGITSDYLGAAKLYAQAAETTPEADLRAQWGNRIKQSLMLVERARLFGEKDPLSEAIRIYRDVALPLAPKDQRPNDWTQTQLFLGYALNIAGQRGDDAAIRQSMAVYRDALTVATKETSPLIWGRLQMYLGASLKSIGAQGDSQALRDSADAYEAALEVLTRDKYPSDWARTQLGVGAVLRSLGDRQEGPNGGADYHKRAVAAFQSALEVLTRTSSPADWAATQNELGYAFAALAQRGDETATWDAIVAHRSALEVYSRERAPAAWASTQSALGNALAILGDHGDDDARRQAIAAFRSALEVITRKTSGPEWASTQSNLATALRNLGARGDQQALNDSIAAYRAALEVRTLERSPARYALTQYNLALALEMACKSDRSLVDQAVTAVHQAQAGYRAAGIDVYDQTLSNILARLEALR